MLRRDSETLTRLTAEKQALLDTIESLGAEHQSDIPPATSAADAELLALREELEATLLRCQKQNQINGVMLERDRQQTRQLLELLLGKTQQQGQAELYDARGGTHSSFSHGQSLKA